MPLFFATTLFVSALLLFWVQPMIAKMLLPLLGGTPTVWNTCMVFFQATLLAGYAYSHFLTRKLSLRVQALIHVVLLLATFAALPIALSEASAQSAPWQSNPFWWLIQQLFLVVGLPFFTVSTSGPLLQHWFSRTDHPSAKDPYFLYAASNLGSLIALVSYPLLVEPNLRLQQQTSLWTWLYAVLFVLFVGCVWKARSRQKTSETNPAQPAGPQSANDTLTWKRRARWILWAFVPSSLMLGVTTYLTTDIASIPLLWVIPLSLYLLTFVLVFARRQFFPTNLLGKILPMAAIALTFLILTDVKNPAWVLVALHLVFFFVAAMVSHGRLAADRPSSQHLTEFYLCLSVGGVLGGIFNALLSPVVFHTVVEYPLAMVLACLVRPPVTDESKPRPRSLWTDTLLAAGAGLLTGVLAIVIPRFSLQPYQLWMLVIFGAPLVLCYLFVKRPVRFALALGAVMLGANFYTAIHGKTLHTERNFFGALRVTLDPAGRFHRFYHGTTVHGIQFLEQGRQSEPLAYYHRTGPFGQAFTALGGKVPNQQVAVIGLGAGAMASYAASGQQWTFYEIDPAVVRVARDKDFFSYLRASTNASVDYKLGDARLRLREAADGQYHLLICDAFSSDVPPLHLITREAMALYLSKLAPDGLMIFNISSRYLDFRPVLGNLAGSFDLYALGFNEGDVPSSDLNDGKYSSHWVVITRKPRFFGPLMDDARWQPVLPDPKHEVWTDDYSNILAIFNWM